MELAEQEGNVVTFKRTLACDRCDRPWLGKRAKTDAETRALAHRGGWTRQTAEGEGIASTVIDLCATCTEALARIARLEATKQQGST